MPDLAAAPISTSHIFISYSRANKVLVARLIADLQARGVPVWIDRVGLRPGTPNWEQALRDAIQSARAVLLIASPDSRKSPYVSDELSIAAMYKRPVYPVWADGSDWADSIRMGYGSVQFIDARGDQYESALDQVVSVFNNYSPIVVPAPVALPAASTPVTAVPDSMPRNPYKGLNAFTSADQADFFGRDTLIDELTAAVEEMGKTRFLSIVGPSGSGKSSVVMAGLLPRLQQSHPDWLYLSPLLPGVSPIRALSTTLARVMPAKSNTAILDDLNNPSAQGLDWLVRTAVSQPTARVVLLIDQFEELFTQTTDETERRQFIDLLATASIESDGPLLLIVTLRADFYDRPINYPVLGKLFEQFTKTIPPLSLSDIRDAIEKPAAQPDVTLTFDDGLVAELVFDIREQIGAMPLLQFTLDQLFQRRDGHRLTMDAYRELGGVRGALTKHAEQTFAALPSDAHRRLTRALFLRLIEPGVTVQDTTRRRAALNELDLPEPAQNVIMTNCRETFVAARLITTSQNDQVITIEVSHEALIREWPRFQNWIETTHQDVQFQQSLSKDASGWLRLDKPVDRLYRGSILDEAKDWLSRNIPSADERIFIDSAISTTAQQEKLRMIPTRYVCALIGTIAGFGLYLYISFYIDVASIGSLFANMPLSNASAAIVWGFLFSFPILIAAELTSWLPRWRRIFKLLLVLSISGFLCTLVFLFIRSSFFNITDPMNTSDVIYFVGFATIFSAGITFSHVYAMSTFIKLILGSGGIFIALFLSYCAYTLGLSNEILLDIGSSKRPSIIYPIFYALLIALNVTIFTLLPVWFPWKKVKARVD